LKLRTVYKYGGWRVGSHAVVVQCELGGRRRVQPVLQHEGVFRQVPVVVHHGGRVPRVTHHERTVDAVSALEARVRVPVVRAGVRHLEPAAKKGS